MIEEWNDKHEETLLQEAEILYLVVIDECHVVDIRYSAIFSLSYLYRLINRSEKAKETVDLLSPMKYCRENVLYCGIGDGNTELYIQDLIDKYVDGLGIAITNYTAELPNDSTTWQKKIDMINISNELYKMIYGDNLMFYHERVSNNHCLISIYQLALGKNEEALESLEKMCYHAIEFDKSYIENHG